MKSFRMIMNLVKFYCLQNNLLEYHQGLKSIKLHFVMYLDLKTILTSSCQNNQGFSHMTEIIKNTAFGTSLFVKFS